MNTQNKIRTVGILPRAMITSTGSERLFVNGSYLKIFEDRNINYFILPFRSPDFGALLDMCDGILIPGGDDIDPVYFGEEDTGLSHIVDRKIDLIDKAAVEHCIEHRKPLLGICRGIQTIAVFAGGSLYQDIPAAGLHHDVVDAGHDVVKTGSASLADMLPDSFHTNSYHHQSVKDVPDGFVTTFMHNDIIEAIEHKTLPIIGIQWHPERLNTEESKIIFDYFCGLL